MARMQIKVTKRLAKFIDKLVKEEGIADGAYLSLVSPINYPGGVYTPEADEDYDLAADRYKVIEVVYPYDYYACPCTINTPMLLEELRMRAKYNRPVNTEEDLREMLKDMIEV